MQKTLKLLVTPSPLMVLNLLRLMADPPTVSTHFRKIDTNTDSGVPIISVFVVKHFILPFQLKVMERHPLEGLESFIPLYPYAGQRYLMVVAPASCSN
jgi:ureidoglycolate hydrolase